MTKSLYFEAALYTAIAALTPIVVVLQGHEPLTGRAIAALVLGGIVTGCSTLKAFMSTSYSRATADAILVRDQVSNENKITR